MILKKLISTMSVYRLCYLLNLMVLPMGSMESGDVEKVLAEDQIWRRARRPSKIGGKSNLPGASGLGCKYWTTDVRKGGVTVC